jgi:hypothetical protein
MYDVMKIHQLFRESVPEVVANKITNCFGLESLKDASMFCRDDMIRLHSVEQISYMLDELKHYYLPCKARIYLHDLNEKKIITILRQILRLFNMSLNSTQKYVKYKKITYYYMTELNHTKKNLKMTQQNITIDFE